MNKFIFILSPLLLVSSATATKPCPPHPCLNSDNSFNSSKCIASADWIATGSITKVINDKQGHPLNKNFASFTFIPETFEKGKQHRQHYRFKVGWCHNRTELPKDITGTFRIYGSYVKDSKDGHRYLYLNKVNNDSRN